MKDLLKVTGSHVHWKSGNILETVLYRNIITTGHNRKWYLYSAYLIAAVVMTLSVLEGLKVISCCKLFQVRYFEFVAHRTIPCTAVLLVENCFSIVFIRLLCMCDFVKNRTLLNNSIKCLPCYHLCIVEADLALRNQPNIHCGRWSLCYVNTSRSFRSTWIGCNSIKLTYKRYSSLTLQVYPYC